MLFRPMRFGELLDGLFRSYRRTFWPLWSFFFLIHTPFFLLFITNLLHTFELWLALFAVLYLFILYPLWQSGCTHVVMHQVQKKQPKLTWHTLFLLALRRIWSLWIVNALLLIGLLLLSALIGAVVGSPLLFIDPDSATWEEMFWPLLALASLPCLLVVSYLWIRLSLVLPIISVESLSIRQALKRSWALTRHTYWRLLARWLSLLILQVPLFFIWIVYTDPFTSPKLFSIVFCAVTTPIALGLAPILLSLLYIDQRARTEAYDLTLQLADGGEA
jgi:hypothetical protein